MNEDFRRHFQIGQQYFASGNYERATREFEAALAIVPEQSYAGLTLVRCWLHLEKDDKAQRELDIALGYNPNNPDAHYLASYVPRRARKWKVALASIDAALQLSPENDDYFERRAYLLSRLGRYSDALESGRRALELEPDSPSHHRQMAETLFDEAESFGPALSQIGLSRAKHEWASFHVARALELAPDNARSQMMAARLKIFDQEYEASLEKWEEALRLNPNDKWTQNEFRKAKRQANMARWLERCWRVFYRWIPWPLRLPLTWGAMLASFWWGVMHRLGPRFLEGQALLFILAFPFGALMTPLLLRDWLRFVPDRFLDASLRPLKKPPLR
jgi:tetratricopeptide (TPR) repeat protein